MLHLSTGLLQFPARRPVILTEVFRYYISCFRVNIAHYATFLIELKAELEVGETIVTVKWLPVLRHIREVPG
jgi:hypothetical protein